MSQTLSSAAVVIGALRVKNLVTKIAGKISMRLCLSRLPDKSVYLKNYFSYFSAKTNFVGTQKNRLNRDGSFEHPKHMYILLGKIIITILHSKISHNWSYDIHCHL